MAFLAALAALICFVLALFIPVIGPLSVVILGLAFLAGWALLLSERPHRR